MGSSKVNWNKPDPVFDCPFESAKLGSSEKKRASPHLRVIQQSQKRNVPDLHLFSGVYRLWKKMKNVISDWMYTSTT